MTGDGGRIMMGVRRLSFVFRRMMLVSMPVIGVAVQVVVAVFDAVDD